MCIKKYIKPIAAANLMFSAGTTLAQEITKEPYTANEILTNAMFWILSGIVIILFIIITVLASAVKNMAEFWKNSKSTLKTLALIVVTLFSVDLFAQNESEKITALATNIGGLTPTVFYLFLTIIAIEISIIAALFFILKRLINLNKKEEEIVVVKEVSLLDKFNASVAVENEKDILLDHNYDGIKELDNSLPPWWKYGFYFTIVWSIIYLIYYHLGSGPSSEKEYNDEVALAQLQIEEYMKKSANAVDENSVTLASDASSLDAGKSIYMDNCAACHGRLGEGGVGPNLTDDYWLHGGSIKDVFKTIKYGVPAKGMKSWQAELSPSQIRQVASFIKSLHGTNPPNAKEKQGELYKEDATENNTTATENTTADSTAVVANP
ncbi:MAG: cbb3-type cytochrome c oxidase N-terminal domain-containing protein [Bacteroidia bacterium]